MTIISDKIAELRGLLVKDLGGLSSSGIASLKWELANHIPNLLNVIERLIVERDNQYDENVGQIARYAALEAERDKYRAIAVRLAKAHNDASYINDFITPIFNDPDIAVLLKEEDHG